MDNQEPIFVFASSEIQDILADNQIDIVDVLRAEGFDLQRSLARNPAQKYGPGYKEPATVILATAALVAALTPVISKLISALAHKAVLVQEMVLTPVLDEQGNVVQDVLGNPVLYWAKKSQILESTEAQETPSILVRGHGIEININSLAKE
jgi:hypothetical protein